MKKCFIAISFCLAPLLLFSQSYSEYTILKQKGDSLGGIGDFKNAALKYNSAIRAGGFYAANNDRWTAACYWRAANFTDSTFDQLNAVADSKELTFDYIERIMGDDDCFSTLHNDERWKDVKEKMFLNAYRKYTTALKEAVGENIKPVENEKEIALALGNKNDSVIFHLNDPAYVLLKKKMYDKACRYVKVSTIHFQENYWCYQNMGDCYKAKGDAERAFAYYSRALHIKYKLLSINPDTTFNIDSAITVDYQKLSKEFGRKAAPVDYLLFVFANRLLQKGAIDKAYALSKMNIQNHPKSFQANRSMGNYYNKKGDKLKADEYISEALILQHNLPSNFFDSSFNSAVYIASKYEMESKQKSGKVLPPEAIVNNLASQFMTKKMFNKAEQLYKLNITNYPYTPNVYSNMSVYYKIAGNTEKEEEFKKQAEELKNNPVPQPSPQNEVIADTTYDVSVTKPICNQNCPVIWFDEAHDNYHTASGRYKPLANLLANDGFKIVKGITPITKQTLKKVNVVIIAAPGRMTNEEILILNDWIKQGGSLFTVTDHNDYNFDGLLESLGVGTPETEYTEDPLHARVLEDGVTKNPRHIVFSEKDNLLGKHPIIKGRNDSERVKVVKTFSGRTIIAPPGSTILLRISESAVDYLTIETALRTVEASVAVKCMGERVYGVAFTLGKGKVVVVSEAAMLTAQIWTDGTPAAGMNTPGSDNKQFALNIIRWLTGYLK